MPKKVNQYEPERLEVVNKLFEILNITESNNSFISNNLDMDLEKQKEIVELEPLIKKYFIYGKWNYFKDVSLKRRYLSLVKTLLKETGYHVSPLRRTIRVNNESRSVIMYYITKSI
jgi:hypothetical protein